MARELTEEENFMVEAAMAKGFEIMDDDATVFRCTDEQIVALCRAVRGSHRSEPQRAIKAAEGE